MGARVSPVEDADEGADGEFDPYFEPWIQVLPGPAVHADFTAFAAVALPDEDAAAMRRGLSARASASLIRIPARHSSTTSARALRPNGVSPAHRITAMISSTLGGSAG